MSELNVGDYVKVLCEDSRLGKMQFTNPLVTKAIYGEEEPLLYQISTASALEIKLTQHHGVPLANGIMTTAKDLVIGQKLLTKKGNATTITAISRVPATDGLVYNFNTDGASKEGHLIIANGLLMGDVAWQNELGAEIGAVAIRK